MSGPAPAVTEAFRTRDGATLRVRAIEASDREALRANFEGLSERSRYQRFFDAIKHLSEAELTRLTDVDHRDHEALIALDDADRIVGVARMIRLEHRPDTAEAAVTVADAWQGRGVGTELLGRLAERAAELGIHTFVASTLVRNHDMQHLFEHVGRSVRRTGYSGSVVELEIELPAANEQLLAETLRAAARVPPGDR